MPTEAKKVELPDCILEQAVENVRIDISGTEERLGSVTKSAIRRELYRLFYAGVEQGKQLSESTTQ